MNVHGIQLESFLYLDESCLPSIDIHDGSPSSIFSCGGGCCTCVPREAASDSVHGCSRTEFNSSRDVVS
jgi:hypothetical protein